MAACRPPPARLYYGRDTHHSYRRHSGCCYYFPADSGYGDPCLLMKISAISDRPRPGLVSMPRNGEWRMENKSRQATVPMTY